MGDRFYFEVEILQMRVKEKKKTGTGEKDGFGS
jgi:hypothetical protein